MADVVEIKAFREDATIPTKATEGAAGYGGRPRRLRVPVAVAERLHGESLDGQAVEHAHVRVEEGPEDGHVLPADPPQGQADPGNRPGRETTVRPDGGPDQRVPPGQPRGLCHVFRINFRNNIKRI